MKKEEMRQLTESYVERRRIMADKLREMEQSLDSFTEAFKDFTNDPKEDNQERMVLMMGSLEVIEAGTHRSFLRWASIAKVILSCLNDGYSGRSSRGRGGSS